MKKLIPLVSMIFLCFPPLYAATLKEMVDASSPGHGYDRFVTLQTGAVYEGGLYIGKTFNRITGEYEGDEGEDVLIKGNGAVLDLRGGEICISFCEKRLDITDCVIINGTVRFRGVDDYFYTAMPVGSVRYVTFYKPHDYAVRLFGCGDNIRVERNIFVDAVDTGTDYLWWTGVPNEYLPTGCNFAFTGLDLGFPQPFDNWSYHSDPVMNADPIRHYCQLCEYG